MKQLQRTKRHRGSINGRPEPLAVDPRDPGIGHAHQIVRRNSRSGPDRVRVGRHGPAARILGR